MNKLAVIKIKGKQYLVKEEIPFEIENIEGEKGTKLKVDEVLFFADGDKIKIGQPLLEGFSALAEILEQKKSKKVIVAKFKAKSRYRRFKGHRQLKTVIKINKIGFGENKKSGKKLAAN